MILCDHEVNINSINRKAEYIIMHDAIFIMFLLFFMLAAVVSSIDVQKMMNVYAYNVFTSSNMSKKCQTSVSGRNIHSIVIIFLV